MSGAKKRQTFNKHARERAVKEKRALKLEKKRAAAALRLVGGAEPVPDESEEQPDGVLRLVPAEAGEVPATGSPESNGATRELPPAAGADEDAGP